MALLKVNELAQYLNKNENPGSLFLYGEEKYLIDEQIRCLKNKLLADAIEEFNLNSFTSDRLDYGELTDLADTLPMMAKYRVILVDFVKEPKKTDLEVLTRLIENRAESTALIFSMSTGEFRSSFVTKMQKLCVSVRFYSPYSNEIPKWIQKFAKEEGLEISAAAMTAVHEFVGSALADLREAVKHLKLYVGAEAKAIEEEQVLQVLSRTKQDSIFDFTNWVGRNQRWKALQSLQNLLAQGQSEVGILALLKRHIHQLYLVSEMLQRGEDRFAIARALKLPPYFAKDYIEQAPLWSKARLQACIHALSITDKAIKSSPVPAAVWLENFVIKLCR